MKLIIPLPISTHYSSFKAGQCVYFIPYYKENINQIVNVEVSKVISAYDKDKEKWYHYYELNGIEGSFGEGQLYLTFIEAIKRLNENIKLDKFCTEK